MVVCDGGGVCVFTASLTTRPRLHTHEGHTKIQSVASLSALTSSQPYPHLTSHLHDTDDNDGLRFTFPAEASRHVFSHKQTIKTPSD